MRPADVLDTTPRLVSTEDSPPTGKQVVGLYLGPAKIGQGEGCPIVLQDGTYLMRDWSKVFDVDLVSMVAALDEAPRLRFPILGHRYLHRRSREWICRTRYFWCQSMVFEPTFARMPYAIQRPYRAVSGWSAEGNWRRAVYRHFQSPAFEVVPIVHQSSLSSDVGRLLEREGFITGFLAGLEADKKQAR